MCSSVRKQELQEQWPPTAILRRIRRSLGRRSGPPDLEGRESTEEHSRTSAVFDRCDVGPMVATAAAIQRQCERVRRRRRYVAVRKSGEYVVVISFAVSAAIALRHRRLFFFVYAIQFVVAYRIASSSAVLWSSFPFVTLFVVAFALRHVSCYYYCVVMFIIIAFHSLPCLTCCSVCLSWTHSLNLVGLSVCQLRDSFRYISHTFIEAV
jgi:hypothetical protein